MKGIHFLVWALTALLLPGGCQHPKEIKRQDGAANSPETLKKNYVLLVSFDGFRHDYAEMHGARNLLTFGDSGVKAEYMMPSYPASTFPNHYTLATGCYPARSGLVSNSFYDPGRDAWYKTGDRQAVEDGAWYGGTPLWVLAEQQGMRSASFFWVGSEADVQGVHPSYYYRYDGGISNDRRIEQVIEWLQLPEETRPHFITLYFSLVDDAGHNHGPEATKTGEVVREADRLVGELWEKVRTLDLPVNIIITSDHGMQAVDNDHPLDLDKMTDLSGFYIAKSSHTLNLLYAKEPDSSLVELTYQQLKRQEGNDFRVYKMAETPDSLHFRGNPRCGDLLVMAVAPRVFADGPMKVNPGCHGYDPRTPSMWTIFYARGPAFKQGAVLPPFENVHVYPLVAEILGLKYQADGIDGKLEELRNALR